MAAIGGGDATTQDHVIARLASYGIHASVDGSVWWGVSVSRRDASLSRAIIERDPLLCDLGGVLSVRWSEWKTGLPCDAEWMRSKGLRVATPAHGPGSAPEAVRWRRAAYLTTDGTIADAVEVDLDPPSRPAVVLGDRVLP